MKIAIMGAGLAGLSCAVVLEKHGLQPVVFEKKSQVGDRFVNGEVMLSVLHRPVGDCIAHLSEKHGIYLHPTGHISSMRVFSPQRSAVIHGSLGFSNIRGREQDSFEKQLARQFRGEIVYESHASYEQLLQDYTHVVVATGDGDYSGRLGNFREDLSVSLMGVTVEGRFDRFQVSAWLDYELAPRGYGYLIPFSDREANLSLAYPDDTENQRLDMKRQFDGFFRQAEQSLSQPLRITDRWQISRYPIGICREPRLGNTFFVGNCLGSLMPFLGFGQLAALLSGVYAAYDLCGLGHYPELVQPILDSYRHSLILRRAMERLDNGDLDAIVDKLGGFWAHKLFNTPSVDVLKWASRLLEPWVRTRRMSSRS